MKSQKIYGNILVVNGHYQMHVTISTIDSTIKSENVDERVVYIEDLEKRKQAYGICGECKEPGTGEYWCQPYFLNEIKSHLQIYLVNSSDVPTFQVNSDDVPSVSTNLISECFEYRI
ncbi:unnamed protein product [Rhizophagus irregularis]|nr:unnamed protein product [Rhizophagus irregularis]